MLPLGTQTLLYGDFAESWTTGSNTKIIATVREANIGLGFRVSGFGFRV